MQLLNPRTPAITDSRKAVMGFAVSVVLLMAIIAGTSIVGIREVAVASRSLERSHRIVHEEAGVLQDTMDAARSTQEYFETRQPESLQRFQIAKRKVREKLEALRTEFAFNEREKVAMEKVRSEVEAELQRLDLIVGSRGESSQSGATIHLEPATGGSILSAITARLLGSLHTLQESALSSHLHVARGISRWIIFGVLLVAGATLVLLVIAVHLVLRDASARQAVEKELADERNLLRGLIDAIPKHVHVKDLRGRYILANRALLTFLEKIRPGPVEGRTVADYFPQEVAELYSIRDLEVLESGRAFIEQEVAIEVNGEHPRWFSLIKVPLRDAKGQIIGLVGVSEDVTERKANEDRLHNFAERLRQSNQNLTDFASIASHDLQEPLRKIRTFADRLASKCKDALGEDGMDYLARMQNAAERMQKLITDLLMLSRVTSQGSPFKPVDLKEVVTEVLADLEIHIEQSGAKIEVGCLPVIDADPLQMRQLFQNLISNALKFQRSGSKPIVFVSSRILEVTERSLGRSEPGDAVCRIVVEDNGIGFENQYAQKIFTVFQRLHARTEYEGSGIGLAVCRKIADRHGGSITAKSGEDFGATFIVTLPVRQNFTVECS